MFGIPERTFAARCRARTDPVGSTCDTTTLPEGTQSLAVRAQDPAGNIGDSPAVTARIDNTPPGRVDVGVEGGEAWRNRNDFAVAWVNPAEPDRAPIAAAGYTLCSVSDGSCIRGEHAGTDIARFGVAVPAPGEWTLSVWRRDAAGNENEDTASVPVTLRYDPEPPTARLRAAVGDRPDARRRYP